MIEYWKSRLPDNLKKQYDILLKVIKRHGKTVDLLSSSNIVNEIPQIYQYILSDHPELYYVSPQISAVMSSRSITINISYLYDAKQEQKIERSFNNLRTELTKQSSKSEIEKIYASMFLLMKESKYEVNNFYNQNAAAAIHYNTAQCSGFSSAFKYAMDVLGIWSIVVTGSVSNSTQSGPHAWNIVKLNDLYYHVDITTLANTILNDVSQLSQYRLFESDLQKKQQGYIWNTYETPMCSEMVAVASAKSDSFGGGAQPLTKENIVDNSALPVFTRLFDVQSKIRECIKNRTTYYEFLLKIPMYSNEKLIRMILNHALEEGKMESVSFEVEAGCINDKIYIKFNFKN